MNMTDSEYRHANKQMVHNQVLMSLPLIVRDGLTFKFRTNAPKTQVSIDGTAVTYMLVGKPRKYPNAITTEAAPDVSGRIDPNYVGIYVEVKPTPTP